MLLLPQRVRARCSNHRELVQDTWKSEMLRNVWFWIPQTLSAGGNNCVFVGFAGGIFRTPTVGQNYVVIKKIYIVWRYVVIETSVCSGLHEDRQTRLFLVLFFFILPHVKHCLINPLGPQYFIEVLFYWICAQTMELFCNAYVGNIWPKVVLFDYILPVFSFSQWCNIFGSNLECFSKGSAHIIRTPFVKKVTFWMWARWWREMGPVAWSPLSAGIVYVWCCTNTQPPSSSGSTSDCSSQRATLLSQRPYIVWGQIRPRLFAF